MWTELHLPDRKVKGPWIDGVHSQTPMSENYKKCQSMWRWYGNQSGDDDFQYGFDLLSGLCINNFTQFVCCRSYNILTYKLDSLTGTELCIFHLAYSYKFIVNTLHTFIHNIFQFA